MHHWLHQVVEYGQLDPQVKLDTIAFVESNADILFDSPYRKLMDAYSIVLGQASYHSSSDARQVMVAALRYSFRVLQSRVSLHQSQPDIEGILRLMGMIRLVGMEIDALDISSNLLSAQHDILRGFGFSNLGEHDRALVAHAFDALPVGCRISLAEIGGVVTLSGRTLEVNLSSADLPVRMNEVGPKSFTHPVMVVHVEPLFSPGAEILAEAADVIRSLVVDAFINNVRAARSNIYHLAQFIDASMDKDSDSFPCRVIDISRGGISVSTPAINAANNIDTGAPFYFFWLDGSPKHKVVEGIVRWVSRNEGELRIGVSFNHEEPGIHTHMTHDE